MTMTIRYQTKNEPLTQVESDVPNDATIVWLDFEEATSEENFLIENYNFNYLELEDAIKGYHELNINLMMITNTWYFIVCIKMILLL